VSKSGTFTCASPQIARLGTTAQCPYDLCEPGGFCIRNYSQRTHVCASNVSESWKRARYCIEVVYLRLSSVQPAHRRIAAPAGGGGRDVPRRDVIRRFKRAWENHQKTCRPGGGILGRVRQFVDVTVARGKEEATATARARRPENFAAGVGRAPRRGSAVHGTPIYNWRTEGS
jgi:hypothetical protein